MKSRFRNLSLVLRSWPSMLIGLIFGTGFRVLIDHYSQRDFIAGNYGITYGTVNYIVDIASTILLVLFVASFVYKTITFKTIKSNNWRWRAWGLMAALIGGCGCSVTLATLLWATTFGTMIGLAKFFEFLPYGGLELKIIGLLVLAWSIRWNVKNLLVCKLKPRKPNPSASIQTA